MIQIIISIQTVLVHPAFIGIIHKPFNSKYKNTAKQSGILKYLYINIYFNFVWFVYVNGFEVEIVIGVNQNEDSFSILIDLLLSLLVSVIAINK